MKKFSEYQQIEEAPQYRSPHNAKKDLLKMAKGLAQHVKQISPPDPDANPYSPKIGGDPKLYDKDVKFMMKNLARVQNHIDEAIFLLVSINGPMVRRR